ncbi:MAG TPA: hypothetical protein VGG06_21470 [Thermoanaerobaculia bacterium]|jgi:DNA-binding MarR family transcriptional regulator
MSSIPLDLTDLDHADFETEVRPLLDALAADPEPKPARRVRALLLDRALRLLRTGSRTEIDDEATGLERFLASAEGQKLHKGSAEVFGGLSALARLLTGAADRADPAAVDSILRNHSGRGQQVLELLVGRGEPVPRTRIKAELGLSESHLSHVLRELEEADLIVRYRPGRGKEVLVKLGLVGREVVERAVLPSWIQLVIDRLAGLRGGASIDRERLAVELHEHGAPSRLAAEGLAAALARAQHAPLDGIETILAY